MNTNLLDLNNDILNIIGDYVKKDNLEKKLKMVETLMNEEQILNGKKIKFGKISFSIPDRLMMDEDDNLINDKSIIPKDWIKSYIFHYIDYEIIAIKHLRRKIRYSFNFFDDDIIRVKEDANNNKIKLSREDIRMCIWVGFQRCKIVLDYREIYLNMEDENNYLDEYLTSKLLNLIRKKYSFNY